MDWDLKSNLITVEDNHQWKDIDQNIRKLEINSSKSFVKYAKHETKQNI